MLISGIFRNIYRGSFKKFSQVLMEVQNEHLVLSKKHILSNFYNSSNEADQQSIKSILNFIRDKPKTGLASRSLVSFLIEKNLLDASKINYNFEMLLDELESTNEEKSNLENEGVEISKVEHFLECLKQTEGKGERKTRLNMLSELMSKMTQVEKKVLFRIISKKLRIGLTEKSFEFRREESHFNSEGVSKENNLKVIKREHSEQPMLAKPLKNIKEVEEFCSNKNDTVMIADLKYDGERSHIIYEKGKEIIMISRNGKTQKENYGFLAAILQQELSKIETIESIQIDGELVCVSSSLDPLPMQILLTKRGKDYEDPEAKLLVYGFDVLEFNGERLLETPLKKRRSYLPVSEHLKPSECISFKYPDQKDTLLSYFQTALENKYEGLILKGENDFYCTNGSRRHWGKMKKGIKIAETDTGLIDVDLVVMGASYGEGKRSEFLSTFLVGTYHEGKLYPISRIGTGFTEEQLEQFTKEFSSEFLEEKPDFYESPKNIKMHKIISPKYVFKVHCQDITRSPHYKLDYRPEVGGISLRFPVFQEIRNDKEPESCTSEEILSKV